MSLTEPSGMYDVRDVATCSNCEGQRPGKWEGDPTMPMVFRCDACGEITQGVDL